MWCKGIAKAEVLRLDSGDGGPCCLGLGMFGKAALRTAKLLYALAIGAGVIWLAWLCLVHLPAWAAVLVFCLALPLLPLLPLLALAAAPIAAGGALVAGLVVGLVAVVSHCFARRVRADD